MRTLDFCPITLQAGYTTYSPQALRMLFGGRKVSHQMTFRWDDDAAEELATTMQNMSISGAQEKLPAVVENGVVRLAQEGEQSTHILKPAPMDRISYRKQIPANEHLTMQIASQVYGIETAANGLIFDAKDQAIYITRRFDVMPDGGKLSQQDFCALIGKTERTDGEEFKYNGSYEDIARMIRQTIPAWPVAMEQFFRLVVFNYMYGNGDAHLKNFSILQQGDEYRLAPAYDLINTFVHIHGSDLGMSEGLSPRLEKSDAYDRTGHPCREDFANFGRLIGIVPTRIERILSQFDDIPELTRTLVQNSYLLDDSLKRKYMRIVQERHAWYIRRG